MNCIFRKMTKLFMLQMLDAVSMTEEVANWSGTSLLDVSLITLNYFILLSFYIH